VRQDLSQAAPVASACGPRGRASDFVAPAVQDPDMPMRPTFVRVTARRFIRRVEGEARASHAPPDGDAPDLVFPLATEPGAHPAFAIAEDAARSGARVLLVSSAWAPEETLGHLVHRLSGAKLLGAAAISDRAWSAAVHALAELVATDLWLARVDGTDGAAMGRLLDAWHRTLEGKSANAEVIVVIPPAGA
jgi:hypothetical protein